jgi:hypothetical protein
VWVVAIAQRSQCIFLHVGEDQRRASSPTTSEFLVRVSEVTGCPFYQCLDLNSHHPATDELMSELKFRAKSDNRCLLLISGTDLEDQVTVSALHALLEGFDVHLLCDTITTKNSRLEPFLLLRLFQAGAVPSSLRQFLYMWMMYETDPAIANHLHNLHKVCSDAFGVRPA